MQLKRTHESYNDSLSLTIRLLQIIEKYKLKTRYGKITNFPVGEIKEHNPYKQANGGDMILAIELPMTKEEIRTGKNFETSALKEFLGIDVVFSDTMTEVISVEKRGEDYTAEKFRVVSKLEEMSFDLVDKENFDMHSYSYRQKENYFVFDKINHPEQIVLFIRFDPCLMMFNDTKMNYFIKGANPASIKKFDLFMDIKDSNIGQLTLSHSRARGGSSIYTFIAYALYNLYELSKHNDLGIDGSFIDLVGFDSKELGFTNNDLLYINGVKLETKQDLSKESLDILLFNPNNDNIPHTTIPSHQNSINPWDPNTYSKFLLKEDSIKSFSAFEIMPESKREPDIIDLKKDIPGNNRFHIMRTGLFLPRNRSKEEMLKMYDQFIKENNDKHWNRWNKIIARIQKNNPDNLGFVPKLYLALLFIKKYIWSDYRYNHQLSQRCKNKVPYALQFMKNVMKVDPEKFFGIEGYESYFRDLTKAQAIITELELSGNRYNEIGQLKNAENSYYGIESNFFFPKSNVLSAEPKSPGPNLYNPTVHVIINDSYTKQAWKPKIKKFAKEMLKDTKMQLNKVLILTTTSKLETMLLKRVLRDRPLVSQFSEFEKNLVKDRRNKIVAKDIKSMVITQYNYSEVKRRTHWKVDTRISTGALNDYLYVPYSTKKGFYFSGKYFDYDDNRSRWAFWESLMRTRFKKKVVFISERDIARLKKEETELPIFEDFLGEDLFIKKMPMIANRGILVDKREQHLILTNYVRVMQDYFLDELYQRGNISDSYRLTEHIFYQFIKSILTPELRDVLVKMLPFFPIRRLAGSYYNRHNFTSFITIMPDSASFDYNLFLTIRSLRTTTFTEDELSKISIFTEKYHSDKRSSKIEPRSLKLLRDALITLLNKSNNLNLNKEEQEKIVESRVRLYMLDFLSLVKIT